MTPVSPTASIPAQRAKPQRYADDRLNHPQIFHSGTDLKQPPQDAQLEQLSSHPQHSEGSSYVSSRFRLDSGDDLDLDWLLRAFRGGYVVDWSLDLWAGDLLLFAWSCTRSRWDGRVWEACRRLAIADDSAREAGRGLSSLSSVSLGSLSGVSTAGLCLGFTVSLDDVAFFLSTSSSSLSLVGGVSTLGLVLEVGVEDLVCDCCVSSSVSSVSESEDTTLDSSLSLSVELSCFCCCCFFCLAFSCCSRVSRSPRAVAYSSSSMFSTNRPPFGCVFGFGGGVTSRPADESLPDSLPSEDTPPLRRPGLLAAILDLEIVNDQPPGVATRC